MGTSEQHGWNARNELRGLTALRGIAAVIVVIYHLGGEVVDQGGPFALGPVAFLIKDGYVFVDLFFVLSGVVIAHVYGQREIGANARSYCTFLGHRLSRIYPLHLAVLLVLLLEPISRALKGNPMWSGPNNGRSLLSELLLLDSIGLHSQFTWNHVSWSISAEWFAYVLSPWILLLVRPSKSTAKAAVLVLIASWAGLFVLWEVAPEAPAVRLGAVRGVLGFIVGVALYRVHRNKHVVRQTQKTAALVASIAGVLLAAYLGVNEAWFIPSFALLIVASIHSMGLSADILQSRVLVWLGKISYSVYLVQYVFLRAVDLAEPHLDLAERSAGMIWLWSAIWLGALLAVSTLTYRRIEIPAQNFLRGRSKKPAEEKELVSARGAQ